MKKKKGKKVPADTASETASNAEEKAGDDDAVADDEKPEAASSSESPSLAQQSQMRSSSFRAGTAGPASPGPLSPDGDSAPEIYRKQAFRIEELEKDNKKLSRDLLEAEKRWKKAEDELADLREGEGDSKGQSSEVEKLVSRVEPPL